MTICEGNIKLEHKGADSLDIAQVKPLIDEIKRRKEEAIKYIQSLIIYDLSDGDNFAFQVQSCLNAQYENDIRWLRCDVYGKSKRLVFVGVIKKPELIAIWHDLNEVKQ